MSNAGGPTMPHEAIPLTERGHRQARQLADALISEVGQPPAVLVSGMTRAQQTAAPLCEHYDITPRVDQRLNEFSAIDPARIKGLDGPRRKPFIMAYWNDPDPDRRLGREADTFAEFQARVRSFLTSMDGLPHGTFIFGHGIWIGLLMWLLRGHEVDDGDGMRAFRRFQQALPMPNCATFTLRLDNSQWTVSPRAYQKVCSKPGAIQ